MVHEKRIGCALLVSVFLGTAMTTKSCPGDVLFAVFTCHPRNFSQGLVGDIRRLDTQCRAGTFERSITCLTSLAARCQDDQEKRGLLQHYLSVERLGDSWDQLCQRAPSLVEHFQCWEMTLQKSSACIKREMDDLNRRQQSAVKSLSSSRNVTYAAMAMEYVKMTCSTSRGILTCFVPNLRAACPADVYNVMRDTYLAYQPPYCTLPPSASSTSGPGVAFVLAVWIAILLQRFHYS